VHRRLGGDMSIPRPLAIAQPQDTGGEEMDIGFGHRLNTRSGSAAGERRLSHPHAPLHGILLPAGDRIQMRERRTLSGMTT
jgi:hypothetical protein